MNVEELFIETINDIKDRLVEGSDYAMLRSAGLLRQLLLDASPLMHQVNRNYRILLRFPVCGCAYRNTVLVDNPVFYSALSGIHTSGSLVRTCEWVSLQEFLATPVLKLSGELLTVADLVRHSANVLGGVHRGEPRTPKEEALSRFAISPRGNAITINAAQMKSIILVSLDGMQPLVDAVVKKDTPEEST